MLKKENNTGNGSNGVNDSLNDYNVLHVGDRVFKKVELGLDEDEVQGYIEELISERDALLKRQEHLSALAELAEKTVIEANSLSQQMRQKAQNQAKVEAEELKTRAEQEAEQILKDRKAEAEELKAKAEQEAEQILKDRKAEAEELKAKAEQEAEQILKDRKAEAEELKAKAEREAEQILKDRKTEADELKVQAGQEAESIRTEALKQVEIMRGKNMTAIKDEAKDFTQMVQNELLSYIDNIKQYITSMDGQFEKVASFDFAIKGPADDKSGNKTAMFDNSGEKAVSFDQIPWLEVEILPPVDISKIMDLIARLETLPEVKTTDLLPEMPNPIIRVFLNEPSPLAELLNTLPQVKKVMDISDMENLDGSDISAGDMRERIQIVLGENSDTNDEEGEKSSMARTASK